MIKKIILGAVVCVFFILIIPFLNPKQNNEKPKKHPGWLKQELEVKGNYQGPSGIVEQWHLS